MSWTHDPTTHTLSHASGFVIRFEPIYRSMSKQWSDKSVVVEHGNERWRGTMVRGVTRDPTNGMAESRMLDEAHDEFLRILRARVNPWPADNKEDFFPD